MNAMVMELLPGTSMGGDFGAVTTCFTAVGSLGPAYVGFAAERVGFVAAFAGFVPCLAVGLGVLCWLEWSR